MAELDRSCVSVPYEPPTPETDRRIALIGCGGITEQHLAAYTDAGFDVVAFCDLDRERAASRRDEYRVEPELEGSWFPDGFRGAMGELLGAIEADREPSHSARNNLASLELRFAGVASAERGEPVVPGEVRRLPERTPAVVASTASFGRRA